MAKWDAALFGGKIVSAADLAAMTHPGAFPALNAQTRYGYGWLVDAYDGQPRLWHNGGTLGFAASNHVYPALRQTIIVLENNATSSSDAVADAVFDALHPDLAAAAAPAPAPGEDPAVTARAKRVWDELMSGRIDRSQFTDRFNATLTDAVLPQATAQLRTLGTPSSWLFTGKTAVPGATAYDYRLTFANGVSLTVTMTIADDGKVAGYSAHP